MNPFTEFDDFLIDRVFQPVLDRTQITPKTAGEFFMAGSAFVASAHAGYSWQQGQFDFFGTFTDFFCVAAAGYTASVFSSTSKVARNPFRIGLLNIVCRLTWVFMASDQAFKVAFGLKHQYFDMTFQALMILMLYSFSCDNPPPPTKAKVSVWVAQT